MSSKKFGYGHQVICTRRGHTWFRQVGIVSGINSNNFGVRFWNDPAPPTTGRWLKEDDLALLGDQDATVEPIPFVPQIGPEVELVYVSRPHSGAQASVWKAFDRTHERQVAVRIPHEPLSEEAVGHARAIIRVGSHPNIVQIFHCGVVPDPESKGRRTGIIMEWVDGVSLEKRLATVFTVADARRIIYGLLAGLAHIHSAGMRHGDLHAGNVLVGAEVVKIIDLANKESRQRWSSPRTRDQATDLHSARALILDILAKSELHPDLLSQLDARVREAEDLVALQAAADALEPIGLTALKHEAARSVIVLLDGWPEDTRKLVHLVDTVDVSQLDAQVRAGDEEGAPTVHVFVAPSEERADMLAHALAYSRKRGLPPHTGYVITCQTDLGLVLPVRRWSYLPRPDR